MFRLEVTPTGLFRVKSDTALEFLFDPLEPNRSYVAMTLLSKCCDQPLISSYLALATPPTQESYLCNKCYRDSGLDSGFIYMKHSDGTWLIYNEDFFRTLASRECSPLMEDIWREELRTLLASAMDEASLAYMQLPEGNLRGATQLNLGQKLDLLTAILCRLKLANTCN